MYVNKEMLDDSILHAFSANGFSLIGGQESKEQIESYVRFVLNDLRQIEHDFKAKFINKLSIGENIYNSKDTKNKVSIPDAALLDEKSFVCRSGVNGYDLVLPFIYDVDPGLIDVLFKNTKIQNHIIRLSHFQAGIYDRNPETYAANLKRFLKLYIEGMNAATHMKFMVNGSQNICQYWFNMKVPRDRIYDLTCEWSNFLIHPVSNKTTKKSWIEFFENKRLLFITAFPETAKKQIESKNLFKAFGISDTVKLDVQFCKPPVSFCKNYPHENTVDSYRILEQDVSGYDFDIAIIGCGCYGVPVGNYIYSHMNKTAIIVGGVIQLFFAIRGARWNKYDIYNEYWTNVLDSELPENKELVEGGCYF